MSENVVGPRLRRINAPHRRRDVGGSVEIDGYIARIGGGQRATEVIHDIVFGDVRAGEDGVRRAACDSTLRTHSIVHGATAEAGRWRITIVQMKLLKIGRGGSWCPCNHSVGTDHASLR